MEINYNLIYLIYGDEQAYYNQATFSILSAIKHLGRDFATGQITVYTSNPERLRDLPVTTVDISPYLDTWIGGTGYNHRSKNCVLSFSLKKFPVTTVFVDTDTFFIKSPMLIVRSINKKSIFLDCFEYRKKRKLRGFEQDAGQRTWQSGRFGCYKFDIENTEMWNTGIIGLLPSHNKIVEEALWILDSLQSVSTIHTIEQLAFSLSCRRNNIDLFSSKKYVVHYWRSGRKRFITNAIHQFLSQNSQGDFKALLSKLDNVPTRRSLALWLKDRRHRFTAK